jgi:hypothetical protein
MSTADVCRRWLGMFCRNYIWHSIPQQKLVLRALYLQAVGTKMTSDSGMNGFALRGMFLCVNNTSYPFLIAFFNNLRTIQWKDHFHRHKYQFWHVTSRQSVICERSAQSTIWRRPSLDIPSTEQYFSSLCIQSLKYVLNRQYKMYTKWINGCFSVGTLERVIIVAFFYID